MPFANDSLSLFCRGTTCRWMSIEHRLECGAPVVGNELLPVGVQTRLASRLGGDPGRALRVPWTRVSGPDPPMYEVGAGLL